ncbi:hypothetical protein PG993_007125 [Apiospora rasikravindrae]|uniref:Uncharacterized protein n=1 Tax=Apiospora rasikravindrae TaxID=990691 RepID=A0ABR1SWL4_9PEZI
MYYQQNTFVSTLNPSSCKPTAGPLSSQLQTYRGAEFKAARMAPETTLATMSRGGNRTGVLVLHEARAGEDWRGTTNAKERRKLQNRLNVRAYRRRKAIGDARSVAITNAAHPSHAAFQPLSQLVEEEVTCLAPDGTPYGSRAMAFARALAANSIRLSSDHRIPIIYFNVLRAIVTNMTILSQRATGCDHLYVALPTFPAPGQLPDSLVPTARQLAVPHEACIDVIPSPRLRDNCLEAAAQGWLDIEELENDCTGGMCDGPVRTDEPGVIVWRDPWRTDGWEVSAAFSEKYASLLRGCWDILESTNRWRALGGDDPLVIEP